MLSSLLREELTRNWRTKLVALLAAPASLRRFKQRTDHRRYNGAALLGLRGVVVKSHGSADALAFEQALKRAAEAARNDLVSVSARRWMNILLVLAPRSREQRSDFCTACRNGQCFAWGTGH